MRQTFLFGLCSFKDFLSRKKGRFGILHNSEEDTPVVPLLVLSHQQRKLSVLSVYIIAIIQEAPASLLRTTVPPWPRSAPSPSCDDRSSFAPFTRRRCAGEDRALPCPLSNAALQSGKRCVSSRLLSFHDHPDFSDFAGCVFDALFVGLVFFVCWVFDQLRFSGIRLNEARMIFGIFFYGVFGPEKAAAFVCIVVV